MPHEVGQIRAQGIDPKGRKRGSLLALENLSAQRNQVRIIGDGRPNQPDLSAHWGDFMEPLPQKRGLPTSIGKINIAAGTKPASPPAAPADFQKEHAGEFRVFRHQRRQGDRLVQVLDPDPPDPRRGISMGRKGFDGTVRIIAYGVKMGNVDAFDGRQFPP